MAALINHAPQVAGLHLNRLHAEEQINCALDTGNRRAFRVWAGRWRDLTLRIERLLITIATAEE